MQEQQDSQSQSAPKIFKVAIWLQEEERWLNGQVEAEDREDAEEFAGNVAISYGAPTPRYRAYVYPQS